MRSNFVIAIALAVLTAPSGALAWGATGHRYIGISAIEALPADLPGFLRLSAAEIGELSRELDRSKGAGDPHDADLNPAHYLNLDNECRAAGVVALAALPDTRGDFDGALAAASSDSHATGYLPYAIAGAWQQLVSDFAYWRIAAWGEANAASPEARAWFAADRPRREALLLRDIGAYSHFVADGSQPLHVTWHHNGWQGANPAGYATNRLHARIEGYFVRAFVSRTAVTSRMRPYRMRKGDPLARTGAYLRETFDQVTPLYALDKDGGFGAADPRGVAFTAERLAAGSSELRDGLVDAWKASARARVGYAPAVSFEDVAAGKADPFPSIFGKD